MPRLLNHVMNKFYALVGVCLAFSLPFLIFQVCGHVNHKQ
jgi:hypothetical protein